MQVICLLFTGASAQDRFFGYDLSARERQKLEKQIISYRDTLSSVMVGDDYWHRNLSICIIIKSIGVIQMD